MTEQQKSTLSELHNLVADKNYWVDNWHKPTTSFVMWRAINEAIELISELNKEK